MSLVITTLSLLALATEAYSAETFVDALTDGKVTTNVEARYENVDQPGGTAPFTNGTTPTGVRLLEAKAAVIRLRLGYETAEFAGLGGMVQIEHISANNEYNNRVNGKTNYSVVADASVTELNQAYLSYSGVPQTKAKLGRQVIRLDNDRWIGNIVFRQNWQSYDGFTAVNQSLADTTITAGVIGNVNRTFGDASIDTGGTGAFMGNHKMRSPIINVKYKGLGFAEVVGYGYFLDYDPTALAFGKANSRQTVGTRIKGDLAMGESKLLYSAEYASQSDYKNNPNDFRIQYSLLEGGVDFKVAEFKVGYELLSSDGTQAIATPLATLFAFNGWADVFLVTPKNGLRDVYVNAKTSIAGVVLGAHYHDFKADFGGNKYGTEYDLIASMAFNKTYSVGSRYASFKADSAVNRVNCGTCTDTDKLWVYGEMNF